LNPKYQQVIQIIKRLRL